MFCEELINKIYIGIDEYHHENEYAAFLDCYHDIAYHCTEGYRLVLVTNSYAISLSVNGVTKEKIENLCEAEKEWLMEGIEKEEGEPDWVFIETTLFVGERIISVDKSNGVYYVQFDDFMLKIIPHENENDIPFLYNESYTYILGCDRHLKRKCPYCGGDGEILMDCVSDYLVRCKECKRSTWAGMNLINAIDDWNSGELDCDLGDINIE